MYKIMRVHPIDHSTGPEPWDRRLYASPFSAVTAISRDVGVCERIGRLFLPKRYNFQAHAVWIEQASPDEVAEGRADPRGPYNRDYARMHPGQIASEAAALRGVE
jgi:hypothetical protein